MTVTQGSAGLVFLSAAPATFYYFVVDTEGHYALQQLQQNTNTLTNVVEWTEHPALQRGAGAAHHLRIQRQGSTITFLQTINSSQRLLFPPQSP